MEEANGIILILVLILILGAIGLIVFILFKLKEMRDSNKPPDKPINVMTEAELKKSLQLEDINSIRWIEDIIETLLKKEILNSAELPLILQTKLRHKAELRARLAEFKTTTK